MTYNCDPDKWYGNEFFLIQSKLKSGEITNNEYKSLVKGYLSLLMPFLISSMKERGLMRKLSFR